MLGDKGGSGQILCSPVARKLPYLKNLAAPEAIDLPSLENCVTFQINVPHYKSDIASPRVMLSGDFARGIRSMRSKKVMDVFWPDTW